MEMTVERGVNTTVCVVRLCGEVDMSTVPQVRSSVESAVLSGCDNVVLDLSKVTYADSSALGLIVWLDRLLEPRSGKLVLAGAQRDVGRVLELSGLIGLAPTIVSAADVDDAVGGLELPEHRVAPVHTESIRAHADVEDLPRLRTQVCELLGDTGMSDAALFDLRVAVGEALANAIRHGSPGGTADVVDIEVSVYGDRVVVVVTDAGGGFDGSPGVDEDLYASSGRGVMFMRALMDRVDFSIAPGGGTAVTLTKHMERQGDEG